MMIDSSTVVRVTMKIDDNTNSRKRNSNNNDDENGYDGAIIEGGNDVHNINIKSFEAIINDDDNDIEEEEEGVDGEDAADIISTTNYDIISDTLITDDDAGNGDHIYHVDDQSNPNDNDVTIKGTINKPKKRVTKMNKPRRRSTIMKNKNANGTKKTHLPVNKKIEDL